MGKGWCAGLLLLLGWAQLQDDFSDGDFTNSPTWNGTDVHWTITPDKRLRSNGPSATATLYLSTPNALIDNTEWRFWVRVGFNPSTQNFARVYLIADRADLTDPNLQGYYLMLGGITGSGDSLELWLQNGSTHTRLAGGIPGRFGGTNNILRIKVYRSAAGLWEVFSDTLGNDTWESECSITDLTFTTTAYFGVYFQHTSTNRQNLYFDDFYIGPPIVDTTAPRLTEVEVLGTQQIAVTFSEPVEVTSAQTPAHYTITPGPIPITSATPSAPNQVLLQIGSSLQPSVLYQLRVRGVQDRAGNVCEDSTAFVWPEEPLAGEVVFSEIMADPDPPVALPPYEYVEIHNRSSKWFSLAGWQFCDATRCVALPARLLPPGGYLLLGPAAALSSYPDLVALSTWPSLNNTSDSLTLLSPTNIVIDKVAYTDRWYRSSTKKNGGWSLERMNLHDLCATDSNWTASEDPRGGTPGEPNSVLGRWVDTTAPQLLFVSPAPPQTLYLYFSEPVDTVLMRSPAQYQLSNSLNVITVSFPELSQIALTLDSPLQDTEVYTLTVTAADCQGNSRVVTYRFAVPAPPQRFDIVLNEIMADPEPPVGLPAFEYVEVYNRSPRYIDLSNWVLQVGSSRVTLPRVALWPGEYLLLTSPEGAIAYYGRVNALGLSGFPAIPNAGGNITLYDEGMQRIDSVAYKRGWYRNTQKDDGGWSLERIHPDAVCADSLGWRAAEDPTGGTPGRPNSVYDPQADLSPRILRITYQAPLSILIRFSEALPETLLAKPGLYTFEPEILPLAYVPVNRGQAVEIFLMQALEESRFYTIRLTGLQNCQNFPVAPLEGSFWVPSVPQPGDIVVNEILPYPQTGGARYIELYNRTDKLFDLSQLGIGRGDTLTRLTALAKLPTLFPPGGYVCLSADTADVQRRYAPPPTARFHQVASFPAYDYDRDVVWLVRLPDTVVLERAPYEKSYHFPDLRTRRGVALERLSPERSAADPLSWYSAASTVGYGTPGYPNSQREHTLSAQAGIRIEPRTFSPDNDGYDDWALIIIPNDKPDQKVRIAVYYPNGQRIRYLTEGALLEVGENRFRWDGTDDQGYRLPTGVYVVMVELTDGEARRITTHRLLCAIAEKLR
jgi:hypothetical protein